MVDYKKYSLEKLEEWMHDCMSSGEASPQEVYDTIVNVVKEQYNYYKDGASKANKLLQLLNGVKTLDLDLSSLCGNNDYVNFNDNTQVDMSSFCDINDTSDYCNNSWGDFWSTNNSNYYDDVISSATQRDIDKVKKWVLPVEQDLGSDDYYVNFPEDLLEAASLKEGDQVEWVDNGNGSYTLRKTNAI